MVDHRATEECVIRGKVEVPVSAERGLRQSPVDLKTAKRYINRLVPQNLHHFLQTITDEFELTKQEILILTGKAELLGDQLLLARTLQVRDAYLAPLHLFKLICSNECVIQRVKQIHS